MITVMARVSPVDLTTEDYAVYSHIAEHNRSHTHAAKLWVIHVMLQGDRADAAQMYARADAWADAQTAPQ